ncbi:ETX/MTX2 family pore-forming toxin [Paenibacillus sp. MMS18-CY102]|uniref:ETX/MTX2 family pore-forming toxin n=1 Tax=Paenibacillus sp. MMS18-CY102 TaxID=2682849 RepID=UPI00136531AF|nr:ETX/MTX2 family pore-forming toxin [Paenibacillus sp. MMS18-CY102]MWC29581.1 aerolysin family beta-barrel pore-forming toxin [Paenibacillus sp. MMS18-CY102]
MPTETVYHSIISKGKLGNQSLAITAKDNSDSVFLSPHKYGDEYQLWEKRAVRTNDSTAYAIINKKTGTCIGRRSTANGSQLYLENISQADTNDLMVWKDDSVPGTYNAIKNFADWEQKINVPRSSFKDGQELVTWEWSKAADNELWLFLADKKNIKIKHIDFQLEGVDPKVDQPLVTDKQVVKNTSGIDQTQVLTMSYKKGTSYSFTNERGLKISESIEFKAGLPLIGETKVKIGVEGSRTYSQTDATDESEELTLEVPVTVPTGKTIEVSAIILQGKIDVPYTVTFEITYPGYTEEVTASGIFSSVNSYSVFTEFKLL